MKEVDPPPVEHYVDGDTVYKIKEMGQGRPPRIIKKPLVTKKEIKHQNQTRVNKMRELYGIQNNPNPFSESENPDRSPVPHSQPFEYHPQPKYHQTQSTSTPANPPQTVSNTNPKPSAKPASTSPISSQNPKAPNEKSLYSFYQNIIDKNNPDNTLNDLKSKQSHPNYQIPKIVPKKESPSLLQKSSKFQNAARDIVHSSPHESLGKTEKLEEIKEEIKEDFRESVEGKEWRPSPTKTSKFDESDGDGLINWALNLPDEMANSHSSQFYKQYK